jgi:hypothetical protein
MIKITDLGEKSVSWIDMPISKGENENEKE